MYLFADGWIDEWMGGRGIKSFIICTFFEKLEKKSISNFENFRNFKLGIVFFSDFAKKGPQKLEIM